MNEIIPSLLRLDHGKTDRQQEKLLRICMTSKKKNVRALQRDKKNYRTFIENMTGMIHIYLCFFNKILGL
jgi:hypothetical protein